MVSNSPAPSKAALHALRGVLVTTSCSVFLLAEERRRRLKIARATIDNAKKLHTVRSNRGSIALAEAWDGRLPGEESSSTLPKSSQANPYRRRRRDSSIEYLLHEPEFHIHKHNHAGRSANEQDAASADLSTIFQEAIGINVDSFRAASQPESRSHPHFSRKITVPETQKYSTHTKSTYPGGNVDSAESGFMPAVPAAIPESQHEILLAKIETLLAGLKSRDKESGQALNRAEDLNSAIVVFLQLAVVDQQTQHFTKRIKAYGLELLKKATEIDRRRIGEVLSALIPSYRCSHQAVAPFMLWLRQRRDVTTIKVLLEYLSGRKQSRVWMRGILVHRLLSRYVGNSEDFNELKGMYLLLRQAGLFHEIAVAADVAYRIHKFMVMKALEAEDDQFAHKEIQALHKLRPGEAINNDIGLQNRLVVREAAKGNWDIVRDRVSALKEVVPTTSPEFQMMLVKITDSFSRTRSPEQLDALLRAFVAECKMSLKDRWVNMVLDQYASRHNLDAMVSWLEFCNKSGFVLDDGVIEGMLPRCRKYWSFSDKSIAYLYQTLQPLESSDAGLPPAVSESAYEFAVTQLRAGKWSTEQEAFECMQALSQKRWDQVGEAYDKFSKCDLGFSSRCLRLAVSAHLEHGENRLDKAASLIDLAHTQGHDVSEALVPLLLAKLEAGEGPSQVVRKALRHGNRVHDIVFNKAAQVLATRGDMRGSASISELAARVNGNGDLLYNEFIFCNLVFVHTGMANYYPLHNLLARFTSEVQWWRGSPACKETIKLAMKTAAMRAVMDEEKKESHKDALIRLDEALTHVKNCRTTKSDRRAVSQAFIHIVRAGGSRESDEAMGEEPTGTRSLPGDGRAFGYHGSPKAFQNQNRVHVASPPTHAQYEPTTVGGA